MAFEAIRIPQQGPCIIKNHHAMLAPLQIVPDGQVAEWLKAHAWNACVGQKPTESSNLSLSAIFQSYT